MPRTIQDFFHPQLAILAVNLLAAFSSFSKLPFPPLLHRPVRWNRPLWCKSANTFKNPNCRNVFHDTSPPESRRYFSVRFRNVIHATLRRRTPQADNQFIPFFPEFCRTHDVFLPRTNPAGDAQTFHKFVCEFCHPASALCERHWPMLSSWGSFGLVISPSSLAACS
ncbi:Uncharacterised protein [Escherichia coli]|uniref:Uncharacterized protein n=1 Tax=Escherichia coli TaxID=562 RepID=A0A376ZVI2_ECOLX|nr:Uncharacterised protein [Escherichia coli]